MMTLAVLYNMVVIIIRCIYVQRLHLNYQSTWMTFDTFTWMTCDYLCDAVYVIDMFLRAHTGPRHELS